MIAGRIAALDGRTLRGWLFVSAGTPESGPVVLDILADGELAGTVIALHGEDGDRPGELAFELPVPAHLCDGASHMFSGTCDGVPVQFENAAQTLPASNAAPVPAVPLRAEGRLDMISESGYVLGWAWYPAAPAQRVEIEFLVDGQVAGTALAASMRPDVLEAGFGDGYCGFSWPLPQDLLSRPRDTLVAARDKISGAVLPEPRLFRQKSVVDAVQKLAALEDEIRLLRATVQGLQGREPEAVSLFRTVGEFFMQLAESAAAGRPPGSLRLLENAAADIVGALPVIAVPAAARPDVTVCLLARGQAAEMHEALAASFCGAAAPKHRKIEILLLDDGNCPEAALLPAVVQNLRYARAAGGPAAISAAMRLAAGRIAVFCSAGGARWQTDWAEALAGFDDPTLAALAAHVSENGVLRHAGVSLSAGVVQLDLTAAGQRREADAVAADAFALRCSTFARLGGLDENFATAGAALAEFCQRARAAGGLVGYDPAFAVDLPAGSAPPDGPVGFAARQADAARLRDVLAARRRAAE
jgi:hypothetical protein